MDNKWNNFQESPSKKFGHEVPIYTPSVFREFRGEIFTTYHSEEHPVMNQIHYDKVTPRNDLVYSDALVL